MSSIPRPLATAGEHKHAAGHRDRQNPWSAFLHESGYYLKAGSETLSGVTARATPRRCRNVDRVVATAYTRRPVLWLCATFRPGLTDKEPTDDQQPFERSFPLCSLRFFERSSGAAPRGLVPDLPTTIVPLHHPSLIDFPVRTR